MPAAPILVVDDHDSKRLAIEAILAPLGHEIVSVGSGEAALHAVMERSFAVILMDVQMPAMNGYETVRLIRMRSDCEHTPIIFITSFARDEAQVPIAYATGAVDFMFAPIVPDVLRAKVGVFVDLFLKSLDLERSLHELTVLSDESRDIGARTRAILDNVADGIVTVGDGGVIESFNRAATELFGYSEEDAVGRAFSIMLAPRERVDGAEACGRRSDGSTFPMELHLSAVQLGSRNIHIACVRDVSERSNYTKSLQHQALHDELTGLPNRVLFADRVGHALRGSARSGAAVALLVLDLNGFKQVNDSLGHQHGDRLLRLVSDRLVANLRDGDTVARLGGDEFGVLPVSGTDLAGAATVVWRIQQAFSEPFRIEGHDLEIQASIGVVLAPDHGDNIDDLLRRADLAMYAAKRNGTGYAMFATEQEAEPARRLALLADLRNCVRRDELVLHYQPKVDLVTHQTVGVEALVRWNHPSGRLVMPDEFMPEVERNELIVPLTAWVIDSALRQLAIWREQGYDLAMAVNLGSRCLADGTGLFETADDLTRKWDIPPEKLTFELTEHALIDTAVPGLLGRLATMDERLSIDDFGTGYSSLVYLQRLPVVEIKIDRSFVSTMALVEGDAVIVHSIIDLAHNLSLKVVAEGVEDEMTMRMLIEGGCDEAQGYHFSRPLPADAVCEWLEASPFGQARWRVDEVGPPLARLAS